MGVSLMLTGFVAGCNETPVETKRSLSQMACLDRAQKLFPAINALDEVKNGSNDLGNFETNSAADENAVDYRIQSTGQFVAEFVMEAGSDVPAVKIGCTGDFNASRITSVTYNGTIKRPSTGEVWSF